MGGELLDVVYATLQRLPSVTELTLEACVVRTAALCLANWDDEVLLTVAHCLPECCVLKVTYQAGAPDNTFLFNLDFPDVAESLLSHSIAISFLYTCMD